MELPVLRALEEVGHPVVRPSHGRVDVVGKAGPVVRYFSLKNIFWIMEKLIYQITNNICNQNSKLCFFKVF
jgi:hypothetical protein